MKIIPINQVANIEYYFKRYLLGLLFLISPLYVSAQDIELREQFNGRYDFTAIGNTLNTGPNSCNILTGNSAELTSLTGDQDIVAARLYWAGSGGTPFDTWPGDYQVTLNGVEINAERTFLNNDTARPYFGASADVTSIVTTTRNGNYALSDLDLTGNIQNAGGGGQYCASQSGFATDFGGWSIVIIYEDEDNLALNQISLFDGFEIVSGGTPDINITLGPLAVASDELAKIGFLAWEGDAGLQEGENLIINGTQISDPPLNPPNNQFNGTNSYTGSNQLWNMDLDVYDLEGLVDPGDTDILINVGSDADLVLINNVITSVNSVLPDASIIFEPIEFICNNTVDVNWTVFNINSTGELQAGIPIKFYLEGAQIAQDNTTTTIPIDGAETGTVTLTIPTGTVSDPFTIVAVVDDGGGGVSTVNETNENNNEYDQEINLADVTLSVVLDPDILIANNDAICDGEPKNIGIIPGGLTPSGAAATYQWFINGAIIPGATNEDYTVTQAGTYTLEVAYQGCEATDQIIVEFVANPIAGVPSPLVECDEVPNDGEAEFTLTDADADIINGQADVFVTYHELEAQAEAGTNVLPGTYVSSTQTIYARLEENTLGCYNVIELDLIVNAAPAIANPISEYPLCDNDGDGIEVFDLTSKNTEIENGLSNIILTYYNTQVDAELGDPATEIPTPNTYPSAGSETIWVRAVNLDDCITVSSFELELLGVVFNPITRFSVCDDIIRDGFTEFDLESQTPTIVVGNTNLLVTYHLSELDAESGTIPSLSSPFNNTNNPQIIWVRVEDDITGCYGVFDFLLGVISPIAGTPTPIVVCDEFPTNDGFTDFDLSEADANIIDGQSFMGVRYFETLPEAQLGNPLDALPITYNSSTQTIFARLQSTLPGFED
ncbi:hypothetical protein N9B77_06240, partial [Flavobacteriaceae bacterium]|nr:hypothetical protein [Flavobacteriaceae bacterium]